MKIINIIFDFDGVLAESLEIKSHAFKKMYINYGEKFAENVVVHHKKNGGLSRFEKFKLYNGEWLNQKLSKKIIEKLAFKYSSLVVQGVINSNEVSGTTNFFKNYSQNYNNYLITGTPQREIELILKERKMSRYFSGIYGSPRSKDFWIKKLINENKIFSHNSIFIGDAMVDYIAAKKNNIKFILRQTDENIDMFKNINVPKIPDLVNLELILNNYL